MKQGVASLAQSLALRIPPVRRLRDARDSLLAERDVLASRIAESDVLVSRIASHQTAGSNRDSVFFHYNSSFPAEALIQRHSVGDLHPTAGFLTNFLGVRVDPKFMPTILGGRAGEIEPIPIPANWHADIAEWAAALRAVELARDSFTVIELGCGWGCWLNNTGVAARRRGLKPHLIGIEGDAGHIAFAREACATNGFGPDEVLLHHGVAAASGGVALFPVQATPGTNWGEQPIFGATPEQHRQAEISGSHEIVSMVPLGEVAAPHARIDLLHIDIQGSEAELVADCLPILRDKVAYMVIGTHSRQIEGRLFATLLGAGWVLEIERPAIVTLSGGGPVVTVDGVQGWRNPKLLPPA